MARQTFSDRDARDAVMITATFLGIILLSLLHLAGAALLIGVMVGGVLMLFDHSYLPLFDQWLVAAVLYIVYRLATLASRRGASSIMVVVMPDYPDLDADFGLEGDFRPDSPTLRLPPSAAAAGQFRLPLIGHGR